MSSTRLSVIDCVEFGLMISILCFPRTWFAIVLIVRNRFVAGQYQSSELKRD